MKTWTPSAKQELEHYINAVRGMLDASPEEVQETLENLRAHITLEAEADPGSVVSDTVVRAVIAKVGTPEAITAGASEWEDGARAQRGIVPLKPWAIGAAGAAIVVLVAVGAMVAVSKRYDAAGEGAQAIATQAPVGDGKYTAELIETQAPEFFIARMSQPEPGYHGFAGLWALEFKAAQAAEKQRAQIVKACLDTIGDSARPFQERFQSCYVVCRFHDPAIVTTLSGILLHDPDPTLRGVAACALGQEASAEAQSALRGAQSTESSQEVLSWIQRALDGEFKPAEVMPPGTGPGPLQDQQNGTYTAEAIAEHDTDYFLARIERPDEGYHQFSALWALQIKADRAQAEQRKEIIHACLDAAADPARSFNQRFQCCYVVTVFDEPAIVPVLDKILTSDPDPKLRSVAACALAQTQIIEANAALEAAAASEQDATVQDWIRRGMAGEFTKPTIPEPAPSSEAT